METRLNYFKDSVVESGETGVGGLEEQEGNSKIKQMRTIGSNPTARAEGPREQGRVIEI